jgi:hypothetical protein
MDAIFHSIRASLVFFKLYFYFLVHPERELTTNSNFQRVRFDYDDPLERKT